MFSRSDELAERCDDNRGGEKTSFAAIPGGEICFVVFPHSETCTESKLQKDKRVIIL